MMGPLYFFFISSRVDNNFRLRIPYLLHLLPITIFSLLSIEYYTHGYDYMLSTAQVVKTFRESGNISLMDIVTMTLLNCLFISYLLFSYRKISLFSYDNEDHRFLRNITLATLMITLIEALLDIITEYYRIDYVTPILFALLLYTINYFGFVDSGLLKIRIGKKYQFSPLTKEKSNLIFLKIKSLMENDKLYLDELISLNKLAKEVKVSPHHLSQVINEYTNQNFFHFINKYRIEEAKLKLKDKNRQIASIAYSVGYNSLSAFNRAFKKETNSSPSEYRRLYLKQ